MRVLIRDYPQLRDLCWNRPAAAVIDGRDALALYERNWRFVDRDALIPAERRLLRVLVDRYGSGVLNV